MHGPLDIKFVNSLLDIYIYLYPYIVKVDLTPVCRFSFFFQL